MSDSRLFVYAASGVELRTEALKRARERLRAMGWQVTLDASVRARAQRFAGSDEVRLATLHRIAAEAPSIALACRGGYGLGRLLDAIDWPLLARSVERGTRWVGYSDLTALQTGLLAHTGAVSWHGPMACDDFGRADPEGQPGGGVDEVTRDCFVEAMSGELEAVGWRTEAGFDGLDARGVLWGGNLAVLQAMVGTPHFPGPGGRGVKGGVLFLEDVNEHPYRVERALLHLHQAGVLARQKAVLLGQFSDWRPSPMDRGYTLKSAIAHLRGVCPVPVLTGLPFGHVPTKVTLPVGRKVQLVVQGRDVLLGW